MFEENDMKITRRTRNGCLLAALILVGCFAGLVFLTDFVPGREEQIEPEFVLAYGEVNAEGHIMTEMAEYFAEQVKQLSKGKVLVQIYTAGQMGDDAKCYQAMKMGAMDLYRGNCSSLGGDEKMPMASVLALSYLFYDDTHFWEVCSSSLGQEILEDISDSSKGIRGLTFLDEGARYFFTTDKPIRTLDDMQNMKMRVQTSDVMADTASVLGVETVSMEYVALYSALAVKKVEGAENPLTSYCSNKFYEVAPYFLENAYTHPPGILLISEITWESLGEKYQNVLEEAARRTREYNQERIQEAEKQAYEIMQDSGVVITRLEDPSRWYLAAKSLYPQYEEAFGDVIWKIKHRNYES